MKRVLISAAMAAAAVSLPASAAWAAPGPDPVQPGSQAYTVVPGDSYWSIGQRFGVNMYDLAAWNQRELDSPLDSGWVLQIPPSGWHAAVAAGTTYASGAYTGRSYAVHAYHPQTGVAGASGSPSGVWACIAAHESGSNPSTETGNGYYGMYQFTMSSWRSGGGTGNPAAASAAEQTAVAQRVQAQQGWGAWPVTSRECGA